MIIDNDKKTEIINNIRNIYISFFETGNNYLLRGINEQINKAKYDKIELPSIESIEQDAIIIMANKLFVNNIKQVNSFDYIQILRRLRDSAKKNGMVDQLLNIYQYNSSEFNLEKEELSDPINEQYCDACVDNFLNHTRTIGNSIFPFESRYVRIKSSKMREADTYPDKSILKRIETKVIIEGLKVVITKIKNNDLKRLNQNIVSKIKELGINEIEEYINTGKTSNLNITIFINFLKEKIYDFSEEHCGKYNPYYLFEPDDKDNNTNVYRIYLNTPLTDNTINFIEEYCIECQRQLMSFDMKAFFNKQKENQDVTIFYVTYGDINKKISIIKKLLEKNPDLGLGTPPSACAKIKGLEEIGICNIGTISEYGNRLVNTRTYNSYINELFLKALVDTLHSYGYNFQKIKNQIQIGEELELEKIKDTVRKICSSSLHDDFINKLCYFMHVEHNKENKYAEGVKKNIALDTWYIDRMREKWGTIKKEPSSFAL